MLFSNNRKLLEKYQGVGRMEQFTNRVSCHAEHKSRWFSTGDNNWIKISLKVSLKIKYKLATCLCGHFPILALTKYETSVNYTDHILCANSKMVTSSQDWFVLDNLIHCNYKHLKKDTNLPQIFTQKKWKQNPIKTCIWKAVFIIIPNWIYLSN